MASLAIWFQTKKKTCTSTVNTNYDFTHLPPVDKVHAPVRSKPGTWEKGKSSDGIVKVNWTISGEKLNIWKCWWTTYEDQSHKLTQSTLFSGKLKSKLEITFQVRSQRCGSCSMQFAIQTFKTVFQVDIFHSL